VEATATEIVVINHGRKLQHAAPEKLLQLLEGQVWQWIVPSETLPALKQKNIVSGTVRRADGVQLRVVSASAPSPEAQPIAPSLEDVYLQLVSSNGNQL
jgi:ABC-2 type transport system ATP-binding protein